MMIIKGNPMNIWVDPTPMPLLRPKISHDVTWDWTQDSVARSQHLTSGARFFYLLITVLCDVI
jgi:hypothetical protein